MHGTCTKSVSEHQQTVYCHLKGGFILWWISWVCYPISSAKLWCYLCLYICCYTIKMLPLLHQLCDKGLHLPKLHLCPRSFFISSVMTCLLWFAAWLSLNFFFISSVMKVSTSQSSSPVAVGPATFGRLNDLHLYRSGVGFSGLYCSCFKVLCCGTFAWTMIKYSAKPRN